jgi:serine O-acetyltransferase
LEKSNETQRRNFARLKMIGALSVYRVARILYGLGIPVAPGALTYAGRLLFAGWVPYSAKIGKGVTLGYGGLGVVIHSDAVIGDRVEIGQGVTIGGNARAPGVATIGDDVYIGCGAKILGPVTIGNGAVIGANAVVTHDVEPGEVVAGIPARTLRKTEGANEFLYHRKAR